MFSVAKGSNFTEELVLVSSTPIENGIKVCGGEVVTFTAVGHLSLDFFVTDCLKLETEWLLLDRDSMQARLYPSGFEFALEAPYILRLVAKGNTIVCCTQTEVRSYNLTSLQATKKFQIPTIVQICNDLVLSKCEQISTITEIQSNYQLHLLATQQSEVVDAWMCNDGVLISSNESS